LLAESLGCGNFRG